MYLSRRWVSMFVWLCLSISLGGWRYECRNGCECMTVFLDGCVYMSMGMYVCLSVSVFD